MKLRFCVICGTNKDLQHHHIIPKSQGGDDHQHNFLTLCWEHHKFIHDIRRTRTDGESFSNLVKEGQRRSGNYGGRPKTPKENKVIELYREGHSYRTIRRFTGVALATITRIVKDNSLPPRI
mgnify:CR=1 FL=1